VIPADLPAATIAEVKRLAVEAFRAIDGAGLARVDFLMDGNSGTLYLNEINTLPGFTNISMYSKMWEASGVGYSALVERLIQFGIERHQEKQRLKTSAL
jgi:D-alanine-D-alanine ligase